MGKTYSIYLDNEIARRLELIASKQFDGVVSNAVACAVLLLEDVLKQGFIPEIEVEQKVNYSLKLVKTEASSS